MTHIRRSERWFRILTEARRVTADQRIPLEMLHTAGLLTDAQVAQIWISRRQDAVNLGAYREYGRDRYTWWIYLMIGSLLGICTRFARNKYNWPPGVPLTLPQSIVALIIGYAIFTAAHRTIRKLKGKIASTLRLLLFPALCIIAGLILAVAHGDDDTVAAGTGVLIAAATNANIVLHGRLKRIAFQRKLAQLGRQSTAHYEISNSFLNILANLYNHRQTHRRWRFRLVARLETEAAWLEARMVDWVVPRRFGSARRQRATARELGRQAGATLRDHADAIVLTETTDSFDRIMQTVRDQAVALSAGDSSPIIQENRVWTAQRHHQLITRALPPLVLVITAAVLNHLPGVAVSGASLATIRVGLIVGAVLSALGVSGEDRRSVESAWTSASTPKSKA